MVQFKLDYEQVERLEALMKALPGKSEKSINEVLHTKGVEILKEEIINVIPVSKRKGKLENKTHAKHSDPFVHGNLNLGIILKNRSSFNYLVFPNEGIGKFNPKSQHFMEKGLEIATPKILEELEKRLIEELEEEAYK